MDLMDYRRKIIANFPHLMSASGAVVSFSDGADLPLKSLNVDIEPVQSGTGDPSPDNVRPISGWSAVNVTRCGKNLLDDVTPTVVNAYVSNQNGRPILRSSGESRTVIVQMKPNTTYTYTWNQSAISGARTDDSDVILFDDYPVVGVTLGYSTGGTMQNANNKRTFNSADYKYAALKIANIYRSNYEETLSASMLEVGSTATPYEPYNGVTGTIDLGQTVYGGTLNPLTGVLTVDRYWWELNTEASKWNKSSSYPGGFFTDGANYALNGNRAKPETPFLCSHAKTATTLSEYGANRNVCYMDYSINIRIMSDTATKQDWIDYLTAQKNAGTPVQICCYLKNPVTIQLTPQQIRSLCGNNTIFADTGNVALEYWAHP